ncbi:hypothetical protein ACFQZZ_16790 [Nocardia sp. GCM10030253]|uniref:hypothetical protein n=1 Tax=Nocardia sp. GCM10030253 TaxID=3273404 RepID=UPI0036273271
MSYESVHDDSTLGGGAEDAVPFPPQGISQAGPRQRMPATVRSARLAAWSLAVFGATLTAIAWRAENVELAGAMAFGYFFAWLLAVVACAFGMVGRLVQVIGVALAAIQAFVCLGLVAVGPLTGFLGLGLSLAILVLLCKGQSSAWFTRNR